MKAVKNPSTEKTKTELKIGDVIVAKQGKRKYTITEIDAGVGGKHDPYLKLKTANGETLGHDTYFDSVSATYTVLNA
jgi:hypothetical protein